MPPPTLGSGHIEFDLQDAIAHISIARPKAKNALNLAMYKDLVALLDHCRQNSAVRVICLTGSGNQFTSGNDLKDFLQNVSLGDAQNPIQAFILAVINFNKPIIAGVEGVAYGIGTTLLLHCDYVVAHPQSAFCLPFIKLGLVPEFAASQLLPARVGMARAKEWLLGGEPFSADAALAAGLINAVDASPIAAALANAQVLAALPAQALAATKALIHQHARGDLTAVLNAEIQAFTLALNSPEFKEAATAFFEKRTPNFY